MRASTCATDRHKSRVLIFVVAYEAESTLASVLSRVPSSVFEWDTEVLVIDDSSSDRTFEVGLQASRKSPYRLTILYNHENQGYGGNQKLGYQYAIRREFDYVVLLHGDGQYAPECIPQLLQPLLSGAADAVLGSRMIVRGAALRGGMPLYKFVGNKILTRLQNLVLGSQLSEFHSGFRAYRVASLRRIPFQYNTNAFHFDTEILIQLMLAGCRIVEVPIPTYYGDEICRVNGIRYAKDVMLSTVASRLHRLTIFYDRKFDVDPHTNVHYDLKLGYRSSHTMALEVVAPGSRVLDIGCGPGLFAQELVKKGCAVSGIDQFAPPPERTRVFKEFFRWTEEEEFPIADLSGYDYVLLLDLIEHLQRPELLLDALRHACRSVERRPRFVITTGNVVFVVVRLQTLLGNFNYGKAGILDLTHRRLYTCASLRRLLEQCGFRIRRVEGVPAPFPKALGLNGFSRVLVWLNQVLIRLSKGLFAYQMFVVAEPVATVDALLDDSIWRSAARAETAR